jgi:dephospho-CoA kinase
MSKKNQNKQRNSPLKVGITGGIGSGKTTVCKIFEELGAPVYYADERAKALMTNNKALKNNILGLLGENAYFENGELNRPFIASVVFRDKAKLQQLNDLVHPAVREDGQAWHDSQTAPYTLKEAALLVENGSFRDLDALIVVTAPLEIRLQRVMQRDGADRETVEARMRNQLPEQEKLKHADFVVLNDGEHGLIEQVYGIHKNLLVMKKK